MSAELRGVKPLSYRHTAYPSAWLAGVASFLYSVFFVTHVGGAAAFFLLVGGILGASALIGLYERLVGLSGGYALWCLLFGVAGALLASVHGGYDLANSIHPPSGSSDLPSPVDPRGLATFGFAGISLLGFAVLMLRDNTFSRRLAYLGLVSGALLVLIYLARLIILNASNPVVLGLAGIEGFVVNPAWYVWLGFALRRAPA